MNWLVAAWAFLKGLAAGVKAARAAKAGGELVDGRKQVESTGTAVSDIEAELRRARGEK